MLFALWKFKEQKFLKNHRWNETKFKSLKPEIYIRPFFVLQRQKLKGREWGIVHLVFPYKCYRSSQTFPSIVNLDFENVCADLGQKELLLDVVKHVI